MIGSILWLLAGFVLLIVSADKLIGGASALAKRFGVSDLIVGLTIVAFGTSTPELVVNAAAAGKGSHGLVLGNVIGSNTFNLFIILGIAGLIRPLTVASTTVWKEIPLSFLAALLVLLIAYVGKTALVISRIEAIGLLLIFAVFMIVVFIQMKNESGIAVPSDVPGLSTSSIVVFILGGLLGLYVGGEWVVKHATILAASWGWSEKLIGLTIVAAGTSLPELATSIMAAVRGNADIAMGNVVGSNIFNLLLILPISALISPIAFDPSFTKDLLFLAAGTLVLFGAMFSFTNHKLDRIEAGFLLVAYAAYVVLIL